MAERSALCRRIAPAAVTIALAGRAAVLHAVLITATVSALGSHSNSSTASSDDLNTVRNITNLASKTTLQWLSTAVSVWTPGNASSRSGEDAKKGAHHTTLNYTRPSSSSRAPHSRRRLARIIGGSDATINEFPHQVAWLMFGNFICGGSLLSPEWVISAAQCFLYGNDTQGSTFRVGANHTVQGGSVHAPVSLHQHPAWEAPGMDWDIGLIRIEPPVQLSDSVQPIRLVEPHAQLQDNDVVTVIGWGTTTEHGETFQYGGSYNLQKLAVRLVNHSECVEQYGQVAALSERMLCALSPHKDTCQGDSGGPLMLGAAEDSSLRLLGVVSWGAGCADLRYPGVYSDLRHPSYRQYIEAVTGLKLL